MKIKGVIKRNKLILQVYRFLYDLLSSIIWSIRITIYKLLKTDIVFGCCFVFTSLTGHLKKNNWGDDLNFHLFRLLTKQRIIFVPFFKLMFCPRVIRYSLIGSILGDFSLNNTIVYGSGAITAKAVLVGNPKKILSVRGPLTREVLVQNGIDCPEVYGDPAMLLPFVYKPSITKKNMIGIIPHYRTLDTNWADSDWVSNIKDQYDITVIDMSNYEQWTDIIDRIVSCKMVISESLHGLIVAESYGVPCSWVELIPHNYDFEWNFKFNDFYSSIGKEKEICFKLYDDVDVRSVFKHLSEWSPGSIDYDKMIKAFPFKVKDTLYNE